MIQLYDAGTGEPICRLTEDEMDVIRSVLDDDAEGEGSFVVTADALDQLASDGLGERVLDRLARALDDADELEVRWEEQAEP